MLTEYQITTLRKVRDIILGNPKQFIVHSFYGWSWHKFSPDCTFSKLKHATPKIPNCGTAACICGWITYVVEGKVPRQLVINSRIDTIMLTRQQIEKLYRFSKWPKKFQRAKVEGTPQFARQAARRIEHFIATNGEE